MSISARIREYCEGKNIRQSDLIKKKIATKGTVDKIWHNKQEPSAQFLVNFFTLFEFADVRYIITGIKDLERNVEESKLQYGFCKECIKKDGIIEFLKKECIELRKKLGDNGMGATSQDDFGKKAS